MKRIANDLSVCLKDKFIFAIGILCFRITLDIVYYLLIAPNYTGAGFINQWQYNSCVISYILLFILLCFLLKYFDKTEPSDLILLVILIIAGVPGTSLYSFYPMPSQMCILWMGYFIVLSVAGLIIGRFKLKLPEYRTQVICTYILILIMVGTVIFVWGYYGHFRINFNLLNVYEYRREARTYSMPLIVTYVFSASKTLFPILVVYMLYERKWFWSILCAIAQLASFFVDGSKSTFFFLILALLGYYLYDVHRSKYLIWGFVCINIAALIENLLVGISYIANMFVRRILYVPSLLNYFYYDFFSSNEYDYFRQSFGDWFGLESPYDINIGRLMGYKFFNEIETSANNGLFSDAFCNLGPIGIIIMPIILVVALRVLDSVCQGLDSRIYIIIIIVVPLRFLSSAFFTNMLTHGFLLLCIALFFLPRNPYQTSPKRMEGK